MKNKKPPFEIKEQMINDIIEIAELAGMASMNDKVSSNPTLRRQNRVMVNSVLYSQMYITEND